MFWWICSYCLFFSNIKAYLVGLECLHLWKQALLSISTSWLAVSRSLSTLPTTQTEKESLKLLRVLDGKLPRVTMKCRMKENPGRKAQENFLWLFQCLEHGYLSTVYFCQATVSLSAPPIATSGTSSTTRIPFALTWNTHVSWRVKR